jgi:hypothetical protein
MHRLNADTASQQHTHRVRQKEQALIRAAFAWFDVDQQHGEHSEQSRTALRWIRYSTEALKNEQAKGT